MNDDILKRLEGRLNRRSFLRGSGLAAAGFLGVAAASPFVVFAQQQDKPQDDKKRDDSDAKNGEPKSGTDRSADRDEKTTPDQDASDDPLKRTRIDADGNEYRECPQCGHNMYRQGRTWTCENCGYSYIE